jgi:hypothetical protein
MTTTNKSLDAASVRDKILKAKGNFVKAAWKSNPKPAAAYKDTVLEKHTVAVVQAGVNYANLSSVKDAIAAGERGEVGELPWGQWYVDPLTKKSWFPHVIEHKDNLYLRLYPSQANNHIPKSVYYVNGEVVDKTKFAEYLTPSEAKKLIDPSEEDRPACFTIKADNILDIPEDVVEDEVKDVPTPDPAPKMKTQTITIHTRLQDNGDGGYTFYGYPSEDALIEDHFLNDGDMTDELRQEILDEEDPYENGYIGQETIEVGIDENGVVHLIGNLSFHAGQ